MNDCFALFDERRRPWIDPDLLKQKFLARSAEFHPDRVHSASTQERRAAQERYTELNTAYNCLRDPKERLAHLLELERGAKPTQVQDIPSGLMSLSLEPGIRQFVQPTLTGWKNWPNCSAISSAGASKFRNESCSFLFDHARNLREILWPA